MTCHSIQHLADVVGGRLRLADLPPLGGQWEPIERVVVDAAAVREGDVLLALPELLEADPFYAEQAFDHGALGVITAGRSMEPWAGKFSIEVEDIHWALWQLARHARQQFDGRVIAVTGTVGKSTAAAMIDAVLSPERTGGWHELYDDNEKLAETMLALDELADYAVYELHARQRGDLDMAAHLCCPHVGVVLGEHELSTTIEVGNACSLSQQQAELLSTLPDDGWAVVDGDALQQVSLRKDRVPAMTFGRGGGCDVVASHVLSGDGQLAFVVDGQPVRLAVWGRHYLGPALAAWCVGRISGVSEKNIARRLATFRPLVGRCEVLQVGGARVIDDTASAARPSQAASLTVLRDMNVAGRRIAVCGGSKGVGSLFRRQEAMQLPRSRKAKKTPDPVHADSSLTLRAGIEWGEQVVVTGGADLLVAAGPVGSIIAQGAMAAGMPAGACMVVETEDELSSRVASLVAAGDAVLIKGVANTIVEDMRNHLAGQQLPAAA